MCVLCACKRLVVRLFALILSLARGFAGAREVSELKAAFEGLFDAYFVLDELCCELLGIDNADVFARGEACLCHSCRAESTRTDEYSLFVCSCGFAQISDGLALYMRSPASRVYEEVLAGGVIGGAYVNAARLLVGRDKLNVFETLFVEEADNNMGKALYV